MGPHEPIIRKMLLNEDPGAPDKYGCLVCGLVVNGQLITDAILGAEKLRPRGHYCYRLILGGFLWIFFVSKRPPEAMIASKFLSETGTLTLCFDERLSTQFVAKLAEELKSTGNI